MTRTLISLMAATAMLAAPASADEVWSSEIGEIIYESDIDTSAVLSFPGDGGGVRYLAFIDGLAFNYDDRSRHDGYWTGPSGDGDVECAVSITDHTGETTDNWGRLEVMFVETGYPSAIVAQRGACFDAPEDMLVAKPLLGDPDAE
ncbi:MAG: hypothetical protein MRY64_04090 [Hyphomonadaceae bacterium]|nr:hypothetical protein [Hyphomonadaceae bacterium]